MSQQESGDFRIMDYSDGLPAIDTQNSYSKALRHAVHDSTTR